MDTALVLFAHGARDEAWAEPFRRLKQSIAKRRPDLMVELAFLESMAPALDATLERLAPRHARIVIAPLFMARGGHLKQELPQLLAALRQRHPGCAFDVLRPVGEVQSVLDAMSDWLCDTVADDRQPAR